ncbi:MAG: DUF4169 family protein [Hyphomicrobiaceae bacterium]|nr:DUF4169 family protein [Hyphomicrobiaceae bacterium]
MTAEVVNLRRFRKRREREAKEAEASLNRARSGRSKAERTTADAERSYHVRTLDAAQLQVQSVPTPTPANAAGFPPISQHDNEDLDPGNVS